MSVTLAFGCSHPPGDGRAAGAPDPSARAVSVITVAATSQDVPIYVEGLGTVTAYKTALVRPQVDGRLTDVYFKEGQTVRKGAVLAQVDPRPFEAQLKQAEGALAKDQATLLDNKLNLERYTTLKNDHLVPPQQVDDQQALVGQQEGAVRVDQANIDTARLNIEWARITAPIDGVTGIRQVDPGNVVHAADPTGIVIITQIDPIAVIFTLSQDDLPRVVRAMKELAGSLTDAKQAQERGLPVEAWSRDGQDLLGKGELLLIDNQINQGTATIRLKAVFQNPERVLWPNQFVKAKLRLAVRQQALVVPVQAIQRGPQGTFVYAVGADKTAAVKPVEIDQSAGDLMLLRKGLSVGDLVVVDGQNQLRPGSKVSARSKP